VFFVLAVNLAWAGVDVSQPASDSIKCVQIYYDRTTSPQNTRGKLDAILVANLIGHFPKWQRILVPIERYKKNDLAKCEANFYLGSYYGNSIPSDFEKDFLSASTTVVWLGYGFWANPNWGKVFGADFLGFQAPDLNHRSADGRPGFFRNVLYREQIFPKQMIAETDGSWSGGEIAGLRLRKDSTSEILASIEHSGTGAILPWAIRAKNKYLFSEIPLSFMNEGDRYLVFADLLFDILKEPPKRSQKLAVIRLEDIHTFINKTMLEKAIQTLQNEGAFPALSLIPIFRDPHSVYPAAHGIQLQSLHQDPALVKILLRYRAQGATLIWHGVTHQNDRAESAAAQGVSGEDFEFWDQDRGRPVAGDSIDSVLGRLQIGSREFQKIKIAPTIWLTPHYKASPLDHFVFARVFEWTMGRMLYSTSQAMGLPERSQLAGLPWSQSSAATQRKRLALFRKGQVSPQQNEQVPQFFPFEIDSDYYGQQILPENLGNFQPDLNKQVHQIRTVEQILDDAKKVFVLRDSWASVFFHSYLLEKEMSKAADTSLSRLVHGLKEIGYTFVDLQKFADQNANPHPLPIIDREFTD